MSDPPVPQSQSAATTATKPMAPKTRWPVSIISIRVGEHQARDEIVGHQMLTLRSVATSRKKCAIACNRSRKKAMQVMSLTGHSGGRQAVGLRSSDRE